MDVFQAETEVEKAAETGRRLHRIQEKLSFRG
jgi:hypothetical protein